MKFLSTLLFVLCMSAFAQAQDTDSADKIYDKVDQVASFPGGEGAWSLYLANNFRYPDNAKAAKEQGVVVLSFVVEPTGKISNLKVEESVSPALDENTAYMLYKGGKWAPAMVDGKAVRTRVTLPVRYQL
jgi:periplasmic protein TonB